MRISVGGVLVLAVAGLTYLNLRVSEGYQKSFVFFAVAVTAAATIASVVYLAHSLRIQVEFRLVEAAFSYIHRWNNQAEMGGARKELHSLLAAFKAGDQAKMKELWDGVESGSSLRQALNFIEEVSMAVQDSYADEEILRTAFAGIVLRIYAATHTHVEEARTEDNRQQVWKETTWLYEKWKTN